MEGCTFCEIYEKKVNIINENEHFYSRFDLFPVSPGHVEIIPKKHIVSLLDLTNEEWANLQQAIDHTWKIVQLADKAKVYENLLESPYNKKSEVYLRLMLEHPAIDLKPRDFNSGNNDGPAAGRTIDHLHYHIIPRYAGDMEKPLGGIRNIIPGMGRY